MSTQTKIEIIDSYIEIGYSYEDAYEMMINDYNRGLLTETEETEETTEEDDKVKLLVKVAMGRGYSQNEAETLANKVIEMSTNGNYEKAYKLFLNRLCN
jgi:hypothetical protein